MKNKTIVRIFAIIALIAFVAVALLAAIPNTKATTIAEQEKKQEDARKEQEEALLKIEETQKAVEEQLARVEEIDMEIAAIQTKISEYQAEIDKKVLAIESTEDEIERLSYDLDTQNIAYAQRAESLIKKGGVSYTEIILKAKSIEDMITRMSIIKHIVKYDSERLDEIKKSMTQVDKLKADLLVQKEEVVRLKEEQDAKKVELDGYRAESETIITELQDTIEVFEKTYDAAKKKEEDAKAEADRLRIEAESKTEYALPQNFSAGQFVWPSDSTRYVTSPYGYRIHPVTGSSRFHAGIDIGAAYGTNILASDAGVVIVAGYNSGGYGNYVVISHGGGYSTLYAHCSSLLVSSGQQVSRGQVIAKCGSSGMSTGPHIHYEVQLNGQTTNPMNYFN